MKIDGIKLAEGADISNLTIASGTSFPANANLGELFYRTDIDSALRGLYIFTTQWVRVSTEERLLVTSGTTLPAVGNSVPSALFYLQAQDGLNSPGLYYYASSAWNQIQSAANLSIQLSSDTAANYISFTPQSSGSVDAVKVSSGLTYQPSTSSLAISSSHNGAKLAISGALGSTAAEMWGGISSGNSTFIIGSYLRPTTVDLLDSSTSRSTLGSYSILPVSASNTLSTDAANSYYGRVIIESSSVGGRIGVNGANFEAFRSTSSDLSTAISSMTGVRGTVGHLEGGLPANTITSSVVGSSGTIRSQVGTIVNATAVFGQLTLSNTTQDAAITNGFGLRADLSIGSTGSTGASTLTTYYGLYLNIPVIAGAGVLPTNNWGVYQRDTAANNYFAGPVLFGTTTTTSTARVNIVDNSTKDAFRITQLGSGNVLVVEDSATPDSTPFVIDNSGYVISGATSRTPFTPVGLSPSRIISSDSNSSGGVTSARFSTDNGPAENRLMKSRSTIPGVFATVENLDYIGRIRFLADDGVTGFVTTATIDTLVDGTPASGSVPSSIILSTTPVGSSAAVERIRIDQAGNVRIGPSGTIAGTNLQITAPITGAATSVGVYHTGSIDAAVTTSAHIYRSSPTTAASAFTLPTLYHFTVLPQTFGAGSTVTSQFGYSVSPGMNGATNNYGFVSQLAASTNNWNLYMSGNAPNYLAGSLGIGATGLAGTSLAVFKPLTGAVTARQVNVSYSVLSDVTTSAASYRSSVSTEAVAWTLPSLIHYEANSLTLGAGSSVTNQFGFNAGANLTSATNNYGFYGAIAAGTGRWNMYMAGTASNYMAGSLGIGTTSTAGISLGVNKSLTGAVTARQVNANYTVLSDVTTLASSFRSGVSTEAVAWTLPAFSHFEASSLAAGVGSTITTQYGFLAGSGLSTGATNNYGVYSNLSSSGTNNWNFYAGGTAPNYFAGGISIGTTAQSAPLVIASSATSGPTLRLMNAGNAVSIGDTLGTIEFYSNDASAGATGVFGKIGTFAEKNFDGTAANANNDSYMSFSTTADSVLAERVRIDSAGNVGIGINSPLTTLTVKGAPALTTNTYPYNQYLIGTSAFGAGVGSGIMFAGYSDAVPTTSPFASIHGVKENATSANTAGALTFATTGNGAAMTERMRIDSAGNLLVGLTTAVAAGATLQTANGVTLPATAVASADPNTLDDYEEGVFTPTIAGSTTTGAGTYTTQIGKYQKIGNRVHYSIRIAWTAHTGTGNLQVSGLPFTSAATGDLLYLSSIASNNLTYTGNLYSYVNPGAPTIVISAGAAGAVSSPVAMDTAADLIITGHYEV